MENLSIAVLFLIITITSILKNKKVLSVLSKIQIIGVGISYTVTIIFAFICIYYGGNWMALYAPNVMLKYIIQFIVVLITLYLFVSLLNITLHKITNGVLPRK